MSDQNYSVQNYLPIEQIEIVKNIFNKKKKNLSDITEKLYFNYDPNSESKIEETRLQAGCGPCSSKQAVFHSTPNEQYRNPQFSLSPIYNEGREGNFYLVEEPSSSCYHSSYSSSVHPYLTIGSGDSFNPTRHSTPNLPSCAVGNPILQAAPNNPNTSLSPIRNIENSFNPQYHSTPNAPCVLVHNSPCRSSLSGLSADKITPQNIEIEKINHQLTPNSPHVSVRRHQPTPFEIYQDSSQSSNSHQTCNFQRLYSTPQNMRDRRPQFSFSPIFSECTSGSRSATTLEPHINFEESNFISELLSFMRSQPNSVFQNCLELIMRFLSLLSNANSRTPRSPIVSFPNSTCSCEHSGPLNQSSPPANIPALPYYSVPQPSTVSHQVSPSKIFGPIPSLNSSEFNRMMRVPDFENRSVSWIPGEQFNFEPSFRIGAPPRRCSPLRVSQMIPDDNTIDLNTPPSRRCPLRVSQITPDDNTIDLNSPPPRCSPMRVSQMVPYNNTIDLNSSSSNRCSREKSRSYIGSQIPEYVTPPRPVIDIDTLPSIRSPRRISSPIISLLSERISSPQRVPRRLTYSSDLEESVRLPSIQQVCANLSRNPSPPDPAPRCVQPVRQRSSAIPIRRQDLQRNLPIRPVPVLIRQRQSVLHRQSQPSVQSRELRQRPSFIMQRRLAAREVKFVGPLAHCPRRKGGSNTLSTEFRNNTNVITKMREQSESKSLYSLY